MIGFFDLHHIGDFPSFEIIGSYRFFSSVIIGIGEAMPAPVGLGTEGYAFGIGFGKGLHPRGVYGKGEAAVTDAEGRERIDFVDVDGMTFDEGFAVDALGVNNRAED